MLTISIFFFHFCHDWQAFFRGVCQSFMVGLYGVACRPGLNALIAAEQRIGELLLAIPKAAGNQYTSASTERTAKAKTKAETIAEKGYERHEAQDYQQMAKHPEVWRQDI